MDNIRNRNCCWLTYFHLSTHHLLMSGQLLIHYKLLVAFSIYLDLSIYLLFFLCHSVYNPKISAFSSFVFPSRLPHCRSNKRRRESHYSLNRCVFIFSFDTRIFENSIYLYWQITSLPEDNLVKMLCKI